MFRKNFHTEIEAPTTELYIPTVLQRVPTCPDHKILDGSPCYKLIDGLTGVEVTHGICNKRALRAGMNGHIKPSSLDRSLNRRVQR